ncbi:nicotinamide mononucleotide transporter [Aestuariicella hydrocarbonica]|uniref:Nicotinamide riboside transporter PnuC n=2 Tax=Pseudomaricurvus hydrocarbonicus TaxID=1470433 RepID=A0A9E5JW90_9GAMM|nr:nicotinamide mononucleotide transporter [Aestuariicella hydrocarbonica]
MTGWPESIVSALHAMSGWEAVAVILAVLYLLLAMKESLWCWYAAFFSTLIFIALFWDASLLMESALQIYYLVMAVYGWYQWKFGATDHHGIRIHTWSGKHHLSAISAVLLVAACSGYLLHENTTAAWPYVDSFTTWGSILTTYMVTRKVLENWLYWLVIDGISIFMYLDRGLHLTAVLFVAYLVICVFGFFNWQRQLKDELTQKDTKLVASNG